MAVMTPSTVKAKTLFKPAMKGNAVASGIVASAELSATRQSYTVPATTLWNSGKFNQQGQKWAAVDSGNAAAGVQNRATGRSQFDAIFYAHITTTEIEFAGTKCDIQVWGTAAPSGKTTGFDLLVWVENGGRMQRVTALPVGGSLRERPGQRAISACWPCCPSNRTTPTSPGAWRCAASASRCSSRPTTT
mgnify:CR=1 FL=1